MAYVLESTTPDSADATWVPATPGGLEFWAESPSGDLYPLTTLAQDLGTPDAIVNNVYSRVLTMKDDTDGDTGVTNGNPGISIAFTDGTSPPAEVTRLKGALAAGYFVDSTTNGEILGYAPNGITLGTLRNAGSGVNYIRTTTYGESGPAIAFGYIRGGTAGQYAYLEARETSLAFGTIVQSLDGADAEARILADRNSLAFGRILASDGAYASTATLQARGGLAFGYVYNSAAYGTALIEAGLQEVGGLAFGVAQYGRIQTYGVGMAWGRADGESSEIIAQGDASFAGGHSYGGSGIRAANTASFAFGVSANGGLIETGIGSMAIGFAYGVFLAASGPASFALGSSMTDDIQCVASNAGQIGPGYNDVALSWMVGDPVYGIRICGDGGTKVRNGDIWCDGTDVFVRSGGAVKNLSNIP